MCSPECVARTCSSPPARWVNSPPSQGSRWWRPCPAEAQFSSKEEFENVILRTEPNGTSVRLKDVARVELGLNTYSFDVRLDNQPVAGFGVLLSPGANALDVARLVKERMDELAPSFPRGRGVVPAVRRDHLHQRRHPRSGGHAAHRGGAGVHRDAGVPAELPRHAHSHAGGARGAHGRVHRHVGLRFLDQPAHVVWHGAGHRHRGRRRHRGHRIRRTHHARGASSAEGSHAQGDDADHQPDHRDFRGARGGVHPERVAVGLGGHDLPAVRDDHRDLHGFLGVPGAVADAGAVRHAAAARASQGKPVLQAVQSRLRQHAEVLPALGQVQPAPSALLARGLPGAVARGRFHLHARAGQLRARGRPGLHHRHGDDASRHQPAAHARVHAQRQRTAAHQRGGGLGVRSHRLQLHRQR